jgi:hypothetical protein
VVVRRPVEKPLPTLLVVLQVGRDDVDRVSFLGETGRDLLRVGLGRTVEPRLPERVQLEVLTIEDQFRDSAPAKIGA